MRIIVTFVGFALCMVHWGCSQNEIVRNDEARQTKQEPDFSQSTERRHRQRRRERRRQRKGRKQPVLKTVTRPVLKEPQLVALNNSNKPNHYLHMESAVLPEETPYQAPPQRNEGVVVSGINTSPVPVVPQENPSSTVGVTESAKVEKGIEILTRSLREYAKRLHVGESVIQPDWDAIRTIRALPDTIVHIMESLRRELLETPVMIPSCAFTQLFVASKMEESEAKQEVLGRLAHSIQDDSICPCKDSYEGLILVLEDSSRSRESSVLQEWEKKAVAVYRHFESLVEKRLMLEDVNYLKLDAQIRRYSRDIKIQAV
jgi:hypothetical protein